MPILNPQWAVIEVILPPVAKGGRPPTDPRLVLDAISLYREGGGVRINSGDWSGASGFTIFQTGSQRGTHWTPSNEVRMPLLPTATKVPFP